MAPDKHSEDPALEALAARMRVCLGDASGANQGGTPTLLDYADLREIQRGGQGVVYEARQVSTGRRVAIKRLEARGAGAARHAQRFEREIDVAAALVHPNVVPMFDRGRTDDGDEYFVMDFIDGLPIDRYADDARLSTSDRVALLDRVCAAIAYAHRCGVIHRDLKPENVLVDETGEPRVLDFGLAKPIADAEFDVTRAGEFLGTLAHAAPEQLGGAPDAIDEHTDVHGLGVLAYRVLSGAHPFDTDGSLQDLVATITDIDPLPPSRHQPQLDGDLDALCLTCLAKDPAARYASVDALRRDLAAWRDGEPLAARSHHRGYVLRRTLRRHRALVTSVALVIAGLSVATVVAWSALGDARREARRAETLSDFFVEALVAAEPGLHPRDITLVQWVERARLDVGTRFADDPVAEAAVRDAVGHVLRSAGALADAETEFDEALALLADTGESDGRQALATELHRLRTLHQLGRWDEADAGYTAIAPRIAGQPTDDRLDLATRAAFGLGSLRLAQGRTDDAITMLADAVHANVEANRPDLEAMLLPLQADALRSGRRFDEALAVHERIEALAVPKQGLGVERARHGRALLLAELGRYDEAITMLTDIDVRMAGVLGGSHPSTARLRANLAGVLDDAGRVDDAVAMFTSCLGDASTLGPRHSTILDVHHGLGTIARRRKDFAQAEPHLRRAYDGRRVRLGSDAEDTLRTSIELALTVGRLGSLDEAEDLLRDAVERARRTLGRHARTTTAAERSLAVLLLDTLRPEEAVPLWLGLASREHADVADLAACSLQAALALARAGRVDEAVPHAEQAHARFTSRGDHDAPGAREAAGFLVQLHRARGDTEAAAAWGVQREAAMGDP